MKRAVKQMLANNKNHVFTLQLTSMVDMFTILIVFLLKSYSTSPVNVTPHKGLNLPLSSSQSDPVEAVRLVVSSDGVYIEDEKVINFVDGHFRKEDLDRTDISFVRPLYDSLNKLAEKSKWIAEKNDSHVFEGKIVMQADSKLSFDVLKKVMYTSSMAGYADLKLATIAVQ